MRSLKKPEIEFIVFDNIDIIRTSPACPSDEPFVCTSEWCNLQGCPEDECPNFEW